MKIRGGFWRRLQHLIYHANLRQLAIIRSAFDQDIKKLKTIADAIPQEELDKVEVGHGDPAKTNEDPAGVDV